MYGRFSPTLSCRNETVGVSVASEGASATCSTPTTANTKGSWVAIGTTTFDYNMLTVHMGRSGAAGDYVIDIGVDDGAGNTFVLVPDLYMSVLTTVERYVARLPLYVPKGAALKARVACSLASANTVGVYVTGGSAGWHGAPGFGKCFALYTPTSSSGPVVDAGATAVTKGAWTVLTSSSAARACAVLVAVGGATLTSTTTSPSFLFDVGIGATGSQYVWISDQPIRSTTTHLTQPRIHGPFFGDIPSGTQLQVRASCTSATAAERTFSVAAHGFL